MKPYINNIPEEIYLQIVGDYDGDCDFDFEDLQEPEITWSQEQIFKNDYKYVLEDRVKNRLIDTIEERAEEYADEYMCEDTASACKDGYIKGATDERELLIDKACEYLAEFNKQVVFQVNIDDFRKEMKGE